MKYSFQRAQPNISSDKEGTMGTGSRQLQDFLISNYLDKKRKKAEKGKNIKR